MTITKNSTAIQKVLTRLTRARDKERYINAKYEFDEAARKCALKSKLYHLSQKIFEYERQLRVAMINLKATETPNKQK